MAEGDWYTPFVSTLNSQGVINGYDDGRFGPNDAVKAGDAILMVVKAAGSGDQPPRRGDTTPRAMCSMPWTTAG